MITLQADLHTHTIASGHAYSTIKEMAEAAEFKNIKIMATTDHAPAMPGSAKELHFGNLRSLPRRINNVLILRGVELNVLDLDGTIDLPEKVLNRLDWHIASLHENIFIPEGGADYTDLYIKLAETPFIDMIGHPDSPKFPFDIEKAVKAFKANNKIVELNEHHAFEISPENAVNAEKIVKACAKHGVFISINSDAHTCWDIGRSANSIKMLEKIKFPEELIINTSVEKVLKFLFDKRPEKRPSFDL